MARHAVLFICGLGALGCVPDLDVTRDPVVRGSFGETLYREGCQRLAYNAQREELALGLRETIDVDGSRYGAVCLENAPAPGDAPMQLKVLQTQRPLIVGAVDRLLPEAILDEVEAYLEAIVPLHEDGTMEQTIASLADALGKMENDGDFNRALARVSGRLGYRPLKAGDLVRTTVGYPKIDELLSRSLDLLLDQRDQPVPELRALLTALAKEASTVEEVKVPGDPERTLRVALDLLHTQSPAFGDGPPRLLVERDWRGVARIANDPQSGRPPREFVDNNGDGLPDVDGRGRYVGADGRPLPLASPFATAGVAEPQVKRDAEGRALRADGQPVYRYLDLERTFLAAVTRETASLVDPKKDDALGLVYGAAALLGPRMMVTRTYPAGRSTPASQLTYSGFATKDAALVDLLHAFLQILGEPRAQDTLLATKTLLTKHESQTARVVKAMLDAKDLGAQHPEAQVAETATVYDDIIPILIRILRVPGLLEAVLDALEDPHSRGLATAIAHQAHYKDRFVLDQVSQRANGSWSTAVDRKAPDSDWNRSILQRMAHLVHDANGGEFCNKDGASASVLGLKIGNYKRCEMFRIDDLALFFVLTIADHSITDDRSRPETRNMASFREHMTDALLKGVIPDSGFGDTVIEGLTEIEGFGRFPTSAAAARSLFLDQAHQSAFLRNSIDPVRCNDGDRFVDVHNDTIFAWEAPIPGNPAPFPKDSFYDAVRPLVNAFARFDECLSRDERGACVKKRNAAKIFVDLFAVLHRHWGTPKSSYFGKTYQSALPNQPRYSAGSGVVTYEPLLTKVLRDGDLVPAVLDLGPILRTMTVDGSANGKRFRPGLIETLKYLFDPTFAPPGLAYRDGRRQSLRSDGSPGPGVTPYYLLADAYRKKRQQLAAARAEQRDGWSYATSHLVDNALTVEKDNGAFRVKNRRFHAITLTLIDFLRRRLQLHGDRGDLAAWIQSELPSDLERAVGSPAFAALADLTGRIEADPEARQSLYELLDYLVNQARSDRAFQSALTSVADNFQLFLDDADMVPIGRVLGTVLDPKSGVLDAQLRLMQRSRRLDPNCARKGEANKQCTLVKILRNLYQDTPSGVTPAADLADALAEVNRASPGSGTDYTADDYHFVFANIRDFFTDEERGFPRFIRIVKHRRWPEPSEKAGN